MWHSCGQYSLEAHFEKSEAHVFELYQRFEDLVKSIGPVTVIPQKTRISFQVRVRFAGCNVRKSYLWVHLWLKREIDHPRSVRSTCMDKIAIIGNAGGAKSAHQDPNWPPPGCAAFAVTWRLFKLMRHIHKHIYPQL